MEEIDFLSALIGDVDVVKMWGIYKLMLGD